MRDFSLRGKQDGISSVFNNVIAQLCYVTWQYLHESIRCAFHRAADCTKEKRSICITPRHPFDAMHRENVALYLIHDAYSPACTVGCWFSKEEEGGGRGKRENEKLKIQRLPSNVCFIPRLCVFRLFGERILLAWITERLRLMVEAPQADALNMRTSCKFRKKETIILWKPSCALYFGGYAQVISPSSAAYMKQDSKSMKIFRAYK